MTTIEKPKSAKATAQSLTLSDLVKTYASRGRDKVTAVKGINLDIEPGELVALLGPSGCGKTTTLRMIAGLETVTSGSIKIGDREISQLPAAKRGIGVGFESYALYPPMSIRDNLLYGLKARKVKGADQMVASICDRLEMNDLLDLRPAGLSSGQKQRVALARALVRNPPVLLLDEPLSHLDASARQRVRRELKVLQREFGYTTIVVTHDQVEALSLADRLAVMDAGIVQQFGTPDEVFDDPANLFVATFVGEPQINVLPRHRKGGRWTGACRDRFRHGVSGDECDRRRRRDQGDRRCPPTGLLDESGRRGRPGHSNHRCLLRASAGIRAGDKHCGRDGRRYRRSDPGAGELRA